MKKLVAQDQREAFSDTDPTKVVVGAESEPVNLGTGSEITISELVQLIARLTRFEGEIRWQLDKPDGQPRRRLDVSRALERFGFEAQMPLEEGLRRTVEWYETSRVTNSGRKMLARK